MSAFWVAPMMVASFLYSLMNDYSILLQEAPVTTKALTSATVYTIGDIIAQKSEGANRVDWRRVIRSLLAGGLGHGPMSHFWYNFSENLFEELQWTSWYTVFFKVLLDQCTWGPFWNNTYIILLGLLKFESPRRIGHDIRRTTVPLIVSGLKVWFPAHCVTYGVVHVEYRLLWVDICEILWVTILASQAAGKSKKHKTKQTKPKRELSNLSLAPSTDETVIMSSSHSNPNSPHVYDMVGPYEPIPCSTSGRNRDVHQTNVHRSSTKGGQSRRHSSETFEKGTQMCLELPVIKIL